MPHTPIDYSKTIIYKIVCKDLEVIEIYVGHTTDFKSRKTRHKSDCNNEKKNSYNLKVYKFIRDNGGWENFDMIEIEKYTECKDTNEATARERYWFENLNAKLNSIYPQRTDKELKKYKEEYNKIYYDKNKEELKEQMKQYNKEHKEQQQEYRDEHKKEKNEYMKKYNEQRTNTPYTCSCGWIGNEISKFYHLKSSVQHKEYLESLV